MKVLDPNDVTHTISVIPRFNALAGVTMFMTNETTKLVTQTAVTSYSLNDGVAVLEFTSPTTIVDKDKFSFKLIYEDDEVLYRGKIIATTQDAQDYKLTTGLYIYE